MMTFLQFLREARRNPELNPKTSINDQIRRYAAKHHHDRVFVSFTTIDKLGINPSSEHKTPIGIYAYPVDYVLDRTGEGGSMDNLPFAGRTEYANLFQARGNLIDISNLDPGDVPAMLSEMTALWAKMSAKKFSEARVDIQKFVEDAKKQALVQSVGGRFWYVTRALAYALADLRGGRVIVWWTKIFRDLDVDGVIDNGASIIHQNEPHQAVFFSIQAIANVERVVNRYSPEETEFGVSQGEMNRDRASYVQSAIRSMTEDQIIYEFTRRGPSKFKPTDLNFIKSPHIRRAVVKSDPSLVRNLTRPSTEEQVIGIQADPYIIRSLAMRKLLDSKAVERVLATADEDVAVDVVDQARKLLRDFELNWVPSDALINQLVRRDSYILRQIAVRNKIRVPRSTVELAIKLERGSLPSWLHTLAKDYRINI